MVSKIRTLYRTPVFLLCLIGYTRYMYAWGALAHRWINHHAVYALPEDMGTFWGKNIHYLRERSVVPDRRRAYIPEEGPKHYIHLDYYTLQEGAWPTWQVFCKRYSAAVRQENGILPWHIMHVQEQLRKALVQGNKKLVLQWAAELGHYVADGCVPLHTTHHYDGKLQQQAGIHKLWETTVVEQFVQDFDVSHIQAAYIQDTAQALQEALYHAHAGLESIWQADAKARKLHADQPTKSPQGKLVYSSAYVATWYSLLQGQVERQMRAAIALVSSLWYTCWVDAGRPYME